MALAFAPPVVFAQQQSASSASAIRGGGAAAVAGPVVADDAFLPSNKQRLPQLSEGDTTIKTATRKEGVVSKLEAEIRLLQERLEMLQAHNDELLNLQQQTGGAGHNEPPQQRRTLKHHGSAATERAGNGNNNRQLFGNLFDPTANANPRGVPFGDCYCECASSEPSVRS